MMETFQAGIGNGRDRFVGWWREKWDALRMMDRAKVAAWIGGVALAGMLAAHTWQISSLQRSVAVNEGATASVERRLIAVEKATKIKPMSKKPGAR